MSRVAVLCPTRKRPALFTRLCDKVAETSKAIVLAFIDDDDDSYDAMPWPMNAVRDGGRQCEANSAMNQLAHRHRAKHDIFGMIPDDAYPTIPGWDDYLIEQLGDLARPRALFPPHNCGDYHDLAFVNRTWIETVGWYAVPTCVHYVWPTALSILAESTQKGIDGDPKRIWIDHIMERGPERIIELEDARNFLYWATLERGTPIRKLRALP